jgi:hypothetical protein
MSLTEQCSFADSKFLSHTDRLQRIMHEHQLSSSLYIRKMIKYKTLNYLNDTYEWSSSHGISGFLFIIIFLFRNRPLSNFLGCMSALNSIVASHMHSNCKFGNCNIIGAIAPHCHSLVAHRAQAECIMVRGALCIVRTYTERFLQWFKSYHAQAAQTCISI